MRRALAILGITAILLGMAAPAQALHVGDSTYIHARPVSVGYAPDGESLRVAGQAFCDPAVLRLKQAALEVSQSQPWPDGGATSRLGYFTKQVTCNAKRDGFFLRFPPPLTVDGQVGGEWQPTKVEVAIWLYVCPVTSTHCNHDLRLWFGFTTWPLEKEAA
jgi:hypothetical protein